MVHNSLFSRVYLLFTVFYCFDLVNTSIWWTKGPWHQLCNTPWGQFELDIFPWTFVNETFIYDKSNILQTSCQIKLWNFLLQLEMTWKCSQLFVWEFFRRHISIYRASKNKNKLLPRAQLFDFYVIKFRSNVLP